MVDSLAAIIEQNGASTEQLARSVQSVAQSGQRISDAASGAATSATQLDRASQSVATLAKEADDITRRASQEAKEGGASVQRSIQGFAQGQGLDDAVGDGHSRDGQTGQRHQQHRRHDRPDCRANQSPVAECLDRSGARRGCRPRIRGRRRGDSQSGRSIGEGDVGHRGDHQSAPGGRARGRRCVKRGVAGRRSEQHAG